MGMREACKANLNLFWDSVRQDYLEDFLAAAYAKPWKRKLIRRWLKHRPRRCLVIKQSDFNADPLVIEFGPESFVIQVCEDEPGPRAEVEIIATHLSLIASYTLSWFLLNWLARSIHLPRLFKNLRDHFYAAAIFFIG